MSFQGGRFQIQKVFRIFNKIWVAISHTRYKLGGSWPRRLQRKA